MQNKGLVRLFALLFGLVSVYQLSFTFKANQIEDHAKEIAAERFVAESRIVSSKVLATSYERSI